MGERDTASRPQYTIHDTSRTQHIEVRRDGPTVTRTRPGYVNPLRMNPPTPVGSRAESPVDDALSPSVAVGNKTTPTRDPTARPETGLDMDQLNTALAEQLENAFQIRDKDEASLLTSASEAKEHDDADQVKVDDGPRDTDHGSDALVEGFGKIQVDTKDSESTVTGHAVHAVPLSSKAAGKKPVDVTDASAVDTSKTDGDKRAKPEGVTSDADPGKADNVENGKDKIVDEAGKTAVDVSVRGGKKPTKIHDSMHLDLGASSNFRSINEATKPSNDSAEKLTPASAYATPDEGDGKKQGMRNASHSSMAKVLKEGASALFSKGKKDGEDSKENSPTFADLTQESPIEYRIEQARRYTNTYVELLSPSDTKSPRRANDERVWYSRNLRCTSCEGSCPICETECCIYRAAKEVLAKPKNFQNEMCSRLVEVIDSLGARVKDTSTFNMCTLDTGCGRRVCPNCCGACPTAICRDVQCKECKPDPWAECDWHA